MDSLTGVKVQEVEDTLVKVPVLFLICCVAMGCHSPKSQSEEGTRTPTFLMSPENVEILGSVTLWKSQFGA